MGALTDLADRRDRKDGYFEAQHLYRVNKHRFNISITPEAKKRLIKELTKEFKEETYYYNLVTNLGYFCGLEVHRYFIFYPWTFKDYPESIQLVKDAAKGHGFILIERMSTDNDFFLFHPIEHDIGLEIRDPKNRSPAKMNGIFGDIPCNRPEFGNKLIFSW